MLFYLLYVWLNDVYPLYPCWMSFNLYIFSRIQSHLHRHTWHTLTPCSNPFCLYCTTRSQTLRMSNAKRPFRNPSQRARGWYDDAAPRAMYDQTIFERRRADWNGRPSSAESKQRMTLTGETAVSKTTKTEKRKANNGGETKIVKEINWII